MSLTYHKSYHVALFELYIVLDQVAILIWPGHAWVWRFQPEVSQKMQDSNLQLGVVEPLACIGPEEVLRKQQNTTLSTKGAMPERHRTPICWSTLLPC